MTMQNKSRCHVETTIAVVGGKWKPQILWHLYDGVWRFGELHRLIPNITRKMQSCGCYCTKRNLAP